MGYKLVPPDRNRVKKEVLASELAKNLLLSGVLTENQLKKIVESGFSYEPDLLFPINERLKKIVFSKEMFDLLLDIKMTERYVSLSNNEIVRLLEYLHRDVRSTSREVQSLFNDSLEVVDGIDKVDDVVMNAHVIEFHDGDFSTCDVTDTNHLVLAAKNEEIYPIDFIDCFVDGEKIESAGLPIFHTKRQPSILRFKVNISGDKMVNRIALPVCIPLPAHLYSISLFSSDDSLVKIFNKEDLERELSFDGTSLDLRFTPTRIHSAELLFKGLGSGTIPSEKASIGSLQSTRRLVLQFSSTGGVSDEALSALPSLTDSKSSNQEAVIRTIGILPLISLVEYKERGIFERKVATNKRILATTVDLDKGASDGLAFPSFLVESANPTQKETRRIPSPISSSPSTLIVPLANRVGLYSIPFSSINDSALLLYESKGAMSKAPLNVMVDASSASVEVYGNEDSLLAVEFSRKDVLDRDIAWESSGAVRYDSIGEEASLVFSLELRRAKSKPYETPVVKMAKVVVFSKEETNAGKD